MGWRLHGWRGWLTKTTHNNANDLFSLAAPHQNNIIPGTIYTLRTPVVRKRKAFLKMKNVPGFSFISKLLASLGKSKQDCCSTSSAEQECADTNAGSLIMSLPKNLLDAVAPANSKLALMLSCKTLKNYLLDNHNGLVIRAPPRVDEDVCEEYMGRQHTKRLKVCMKGLMIALQHGGCDLVTLSLSGRGFQEPFPALDNALLSDFIHEYNCKKLQRLSIINFKVPDLVPLSVLRMFPNLTHLQLDYLMICEECNSNDAHPVSVDCKLKHLSIGTYRVFSQAKREAWSSLTTSSLTATNPTTSHILQSVTSLTAVVLHGSFASFVNPANIKQLVLNGKAKQRLCEDVPGDEQLAAAVLQPYTQLTHISADSVEFTADVIPVLLSMHHLQAAELNITKCELQADYSRHKWHLKSLILNADIIKPTTVQTLQRLPLHSITKVQVKRFFAVSLPDSMADEFKNLASRIDWVRQTHEVTVSDGTAAAAAIVSYLNVISMACTLGQDFLSSLVEVAKSRRLTLNTMWYPPPSQQLSSLPILCRHKNTRFVFGMKPVLLHDALPPIHDLTAQNIVGEVLDIVLRLTKSSAASIARHQLQHYLARCSSLDELKFGITLLQDACRNWLECGGSLKDVVQVLNNKFKVVSLIA